MSYWLFVVAGAFVVYALVSRRLSTTAITGPMVFVTVGFIIGTNGFEIVDIEANSEAVTTLLEITLLVVLFSDAYAINSTASNDTDLSLLDAAVASVFRTRDGLTTLADIDDSRTRLPDDTDFVPIEGGNHAQFGDYRPQDGDNPATIGRDEQQDHAVRATVQILRAVG